MLASRAAHVDDYHYTVHHAVGRAVDSVRVEIAEVEQ
jgi:hypothetical protein